MYQNYGDKDFFEHGRLVDEESTGTEYHILACDRCSDMEEIYHFGECIVDISDEWIDRKSVMAFIGMTEAAFNPVLFALGCLDYYSWDNFGADKYFLYNWTHMTRPEVCEILRCRGVQKVETLA